MGRGWDWEWGLLGSVQTCPPGSLRHLGRVVLPLCRERIALSPLPGRLGQRLQSTVMTVLGLRCCGCLLGEWHGECTWPSLSDRCGSAQVPYARSEAHLTELLERVCEKMKEYGEKVDPATHRKSYVRVISHDGTKMDLSETKMDGDVTSRLKFAVSAEALGVRGAPLTELSCQLKGGP